MRVALIIASALALAVVLVIAIGGDEEDEGVVETVTVTTTETVPEPETTPEEPAEPEPADPDAPADGHGGGEAPVKCGRLAYEPNTDSGASGIEIVGGDCAAARAVARAAEPARDELSFETDGFRCEGTRSDEMALETIEWFCIGPDREVVEFRTS